MTQPASPIKHTPPPRGRHAKKAAYSAAPTSSRAGLTTDQVAASRAAHGSNVLSARKRKGFGRQFLSNLGDPVIRILLCALGVNLIFCFKGGDWFETAGIAIAVSLATLISTLSECGSEAAFAKLSEACGHVACRVRRVLTANEPDGSICEIPVEDVVVGDVVLLGAGDMIPADGILLSGELRVDQSAMTGESREVDKSPVPGAASNGAAPLLPHTPHALFRGCVVVSVAIGVMVSSLTENQLVAALGTMGIIFVFVMISFFNGSIDSYFLRSILSWISVMDRYTMLTVGRFDVSAIVYFISLCFSFLFITVRVYEKRRWS